MKSLTDELSQWFKATDFKLEKVYLKNIILEVKRKLGYDLNEHEIILMHNSYMNRERESGKFRKPN